MGSPILEVKHLSKSFGAHVVLKDIDFTVSSAMLPALLVHQAPENPLC